MAYYYPFIILSQKRTIILWNDHLIPEVYKAAWIEIWPRKIQAFSPDFLVRMFSKNGQFLQIFGQITQIFAETVRLRKISSLGNQVEKLAFYPVVIVMYRLGLTTTAVKNYKNSQEKNCAGIHSKITL